MPTQKPRDRREYVRLTVNLPSNPKLVAIDDPAAGWLYVCGVCYSGEHLTDGIVNPAVVARIAGVGREWVAGLVEAGLWHEPGHDCDRCAQPPAGHVVVHDYLEHQRSRAEADAAKRSAVAAAEKRWAKGKPPKPTDADSNANRIPDRNADSSTKGNADSNAEAEAEVEAEVEMPLPSLLTYVGRLAESDARDANTEPARPPTHLLAAWEEIAGPDVDLVREAARYLGTYADRPARDERAAWLGWLVKARDYAARQRGDARPPLGCADCTGGWLPGDEDLPARCPRCKPHAATAQVVQLRAAGVTA